MRVSEQLTRQTLKWNNSLKPPVHSFVFRYTLSMYLQVGGPVLAEVTFIAVWPSVTLRLPDSHVALTSTVTLEMRSTAECASRLRREYLAKELYFHSLEDWENSFGDLAQAKAVSLGNVTNVDRKLFRWSYPCELFDTDGRYQVVLRSSSGTTLAVSNVMITTFSSNYRLSSLHRTVFPCSGAGSTLTLFYTHPPCVGNDKFRVYSLKGPVPLSAALPLERVFVGEFEAAPDRTSVRFRCSIFSKESVGYCFVYVTMSRYGAVAEHRQLCLPSHSSTGRFTSQTTLEIILCFALLLGGREGCSEGREFVQLRNEKVLM